MVNLGISQSDNLGVAASSLCLIHCIATPFLFIAQSCSISCCESSPIWWQWIDYGFLLISVIAVYWSAKKAKSKWIGLGLWLSWFVLSFLILNEKIAWFALAEYFIYIPAGTLIALHLYNQKQCKQQGDCTI